MVSDQTGWSSKRRVIDLCLGIGVLCALIFGRTPIPDVAVGGLAILAGLAASVVHFRAAWKRDDTEQVDVTTEVAQKVDLTAAKSVVAVQLDADAYHAVAGFFSVDEEPDLSRGIQRSWETVENNWSTMLHEYLFQHSTGDPLKIRVLELKRARRMVSFDQGGGVTVNWGGLQFPQPGEGDSSDSELGTWHGKPH